MEGFVEVYGVRANGDVGSLAGGESLKSIGGAFGQESSFIHFRLSPHGGIRPTVGRRSRLALTLIEQETISRGVRAERSARSMARLLIRAPSKMSREIRRNGGYDHYRAAQTDGKAWVRARRPKRCKLACHPWLRRVVVRNLGLNWSPEQIVGWQKRAHPGEERCLTRRSIAVCSPSSRRAYEGVASASSHAAHDAPPETEELARRYPRSRKSSRGAWSLGG